MDWQPQHWSWWIWWLHALGAYYLAGFIWFWFAFRAGEAKAKAGDEGAVRRYNASLRGFPNSLYAKMLGRRALVTSPGVEPTQTNVTRDG